MTIKRSMIVLLTLVLAGLSLGLLSWAIGSVQAEPAGIDLARISEETGYVAAETATSPACVFDAGYQVYLCEPESPVRQLRLDAAERAQAQAMLTSNGGVLLIPDSTNKRIMTFDPTSGNLIDPNFIIMDDDATGTVIHAILSASGTILVSDQTQHVVHEYDLAGAYLGVFAPAGGSDTAILQNIRGMALRPNGNLLVSVGTGTNANAIAEFDTGGTYVGNFVDSGSGGLNSPFDVYERVGLDWLVSSINNNLIIRYELATGNPITNLATITSFPQQIRRIANGNVIVGNFSGTQQGIVELTSEGELVGVHTAPGLTGYRGVYELPGGTLLASTSSGVHEIDRAGNLIDTKYDDSSTRFIEWTALQPLQLRKTVGLDTSVCALTDEINVDPDTAVTYCFEITNSTPVTLTRHTLVDSHLGAILSDFTFTLAPGASIFLTQTALITQPTVNTATWTAYNPGPVDLHEATDVATVTLVPPSISLRKTVGLDPSACALTDGISIPEAAAVTYCFEVTNTGLTTLTLHDLLDSHLGSLLNALPFGLAPGTSAFLTQTRVLTETTINTATWTAYNPESTQMAIATDVASVVVEPEILRVYLTLVLRE
jgi:hypothetical protein